MIREMTMNEMVQIDGGKVTIGSLLVAFGHGAAAGGLSGGILGTEVCPGMGTLAGVLSGGIIGGGTAALQHCLDDIGASTIDDLLEKM
jgi:methenyltetrahydromethanopterin cyclohydrolase